VSISSGQRFRAEGRITQADVQEFREGVMRERGRSRSRARGLSFDLPEWPQVDFAKFGPVGPKRFRASGSSRRIPATATGFSSRTLPSTTRRTSRLEAFAKENAQVAEKGGFSSPCSRFWSRLR